MIPTSRWCLNVLRFGLLMGAAGWGISFYFTFASWGYAANALYSMGAGAIAYRPMFDYWLRMASSVFGCVGLACAFAAFWPERFAPIIQLLGTFHLVIGVTLTIAAWRNQLNSTLHPTFVPDICFCFLTGALILWPVLQAWVTERNRRSCRTAGRAS